MPATLNTSLKASAAGVTSLGFSGYTSVAGSAIVCQVNVGTGPTASFSDNKSDTFAQIGTSQANGGGGFTAGFIAQNVNGGASCTVTMSLTSSGDPSIFLEEWGSVDAACYDSGSLAQNGGVAGSPYSITSGTLAQADSQIINMIGTSSGVNPVTYSNTVGATTLDQTEVNGVSYWTGAIFYKAVLSTTALAVTNAVTSSSDRAQIIFALKAATGGGATYTPPAPVQQVFSQAAASPVPIMRRLLNTALVAAAGVYVPAGAHAAEQAAAAYREPARLTAQPAPARVVPQAAGYVPPPEFIPAPLPVPWPYAQLETWRQQAEIAVLAGRTAIYLRPTPVPKIEPTRWPYEQFEPTTSAAAFGQPTAYALSPTQVPVRQPEWPYAATMLPAPTASQFAQQAAYVGPTAAQALTQAPWPYVLALPVAEIAATIPAVSGVPPSQVAQGVQQAWPYAASMLPQPTASQFGQAAIYLGPTVIAQPVVQSWPYSQAQQTVKAPQAVVSQVPPSATLIAAQQAWPYILAHQSARDIADVVVTGPVAPPPPVFQGWSLPPFPYASAVAITYGPASTIQAPAAIPYSPTLLPVPQPAWPYSATLLPEPTASQWQVNQAAYFGQSPTQQWLSFPPWPYASTLVPAPTASQFGVAPLPPVVSPGSNAMRRWLIQQYTDDFAKRDKLKAAKAEKAKPKKAVPGFFVFSPDPEPDADAVKTAAELDAVFRLALDELSSRQATAARLETLERDVLKPPFKLSLPSIPEKAKKPKDDDDDDLLLLSAL